MKKSRLPFDEEMPVSRSVCFLDLGLDAPPPDPRIGMSAEANAATAQQAQDFYEKVFNDSAPDRAAASARAMEIADAQLASMRQQQGLTDDRINYEKTTFRPLEQKIVKESDEFDTPERRALEAGKAIEGVGAQFGTARQTLARQVGANGGNPNSGNFLSTISAMGVREAATKAAAGNQASNLVETTGRALKADAAALGRGLPSAQATTAGLALNAGNASAANAQQPLNIASQGAGLMGQGFNTAIQGNTQAGNLALGQYNAQLKASDDGGMWGALGQVGGALIAKSDKNAKKDRKPMADEEATDAVRKIPVESWKYKEGQGDGGKHIGPMAQDVQKAAGDQVAPGGKMIDLISANGITLGAVRDLDKRVQKLEKKGAK